MKIPSILFATVFSAVIAACAPTPTSRAAGQVIDDTAVTARVKAEIGESLGVTDAAQINVDTYRGVVSLAGFVNNEQKKRAAGQAAMAAAGVDKVFNNLQIKPRP